MRVLLAGATGAIGTPLIRQLRSAGHDLVAVTRDPDSAIRLAANDVEPVVADVLDRENLLQQLGRVHADAVIAQLTSLKKPPARHRDMRTTNKLRTIGTANLVAAAARLGVERFVTQSMMFGYGYGPGLDHRRTERDLFAPHASGPWKQHLDAMRENERLVLESEEFAGVALRYGLFYGVGAGDDELVEAVRKRRLPVMRSAKPLSWVYIDDAATATVAALERGRRGQAYNVADDAPVSWERLITTLAGLLEAPPPRTLPAWLLRLIAPYAEAVLAGGTTVASGKARRELGWIPAVSSYQEGLRRIVAAHSSAREERAAAV
jgi:nucleoside-diphosphate-sugar epimerase